MFPWLIMILWCCVVICTFEEIFTFSSHYRLASIGKVFHQSAHSYFLGGPFGGVHMQTWSLNPWAGRSGACVHGNQPGVCVCMSRLRVLVQWGETGTWVCMGRSWICGIWPALGCARSSGLWEPLRNWGQGFIWGLESSRCWGGPGTQGHRGLPKASRTTGVGLVLRSTVK